MCQPEPSKAAIIQSASVSMKAFVNLGRRTEKNHNISFCPHQRMLQQINSAIINCLIILHI